jgi:hypothetical protein
MLAMIATSCARSQRGHEASRMVTYLEVLDAFYALLLEHIERVMQLGNLRICRVQGGPVGVGVSL